MKSITIFNNKGGVGKTTLLCNLASYFSIIDEKKILVVDADPQCNATTYLLKEAEINSIYKKETGTIYDIVRPLSRGKGYGKDVPIRKSERFQVDLIPGDPRLSLSEDLLATDWVNGTSGNYRGLQTTFLFYELLQRCQQYDYVFFDVGPSLGAINRAVLIGTNFFVLPCSSDIFSLKAIGNIGVALKSWQDELLNGLSRLKAKESEDFSINGENVTWNPILLGYVVQQYTAKVVEGKREAVRAFETIIKNIPGQIKSSLSNYISKSDSKTFSSMLLGEIPSLQSIVPMSQTANCPIFELKKKDGVVGTHFNKVKEYRETITGIGQRLVKNLSAAS